jgi:prepilin-type N-terminal cleavage/methylation domain-containing protein
MTNDHGMRCGSQGLVRPIPHALERGFSRGFTLIETLVCVAIVAILSLISLSAYNGALDQGDLRFVTPALTKELESLRKETVQINKPITVSFDLKSTNYTIRRGPPSENNLESKVLGGGILKRRITFLRFETLEGGESEPTITFLPAGNHQGGIIYFGTSRAEQNIKVLPGAVVPSFYP